ncbi:MAG: branched-chain amino acid ABC transporter permease [Acidimicrobiia bacterium]
MRGRLAARGRPGTAAVRAYAPIAVTAVVLALVPLRYEDSRTMMGVIITGALFAAYAIGFNVIFGFTGQLFLCMGALAGLGGYASAILSDDSGIPLVPSMALATLLSAAVGGLLSWVAVSRSLGVIFTGIVTLAFSLSFQNLLLGRRDLTGGETGLVVDAGSDTFLGERVQPYYALLAVVVVYLVLVRMLQRSHIGWAFRALRDDEVAAELAGVDVKRYRVLAGAVGAAMIGFAGAVYAHSEGFISPSTYDFGRVDVRVIVMLAFGGIGSLLGPVVGAAAFTIVDEWLVSADEYRLVIYGAVILALFLFFPRGVVPTVGSLAQRLRRRVAARRVPPGAVVQAEGRASGAAAPAATPDVASVGASGAPGVPGAPGDPTLADEGDDDR